MDYEVIVIGCGPAGLSAAVYLGRAHVNTFLIGRKKDSQLAKAHLIENFFGFPEGIAGKELLERGIKQVKKFKAKIVDQEVVDMGAIKGGFSVKTADNKEYTTQLIILATGTPIRLSGIENEEALTGKGVHYCVECDGPFYKNKKVAVIGNGNHAAEDAIDLNIFTKDITIVSNADGFSFSPQMKKALLDHQVKLVDVMVKEFVGDDKFLKEIVLESGRRMSLDGVFMACGTASALDFATKLALQLEKNILVVDSDNMTSVKGIFAAGNCCGRCRQVAKNVGDGCNAALSAIKYLRNKEYYFDYSGGK